MQIGCAVRRVAFAFCIAAALAAGRADAAVVSAGETVRYTFSFATAPTIDPAFGTVDTLAFFVFAALPGGGDPPGTVPIAVTLFDGASQLGQTVVPLGSTFGPIAFTDPSSAFGFARVDIDFSTIADGTIDGTVELSFANPAGPLDLSLSLWGVGAGELRGFAQATPFPSLSGPTVVPAAVPAPASIAILATGMLGLLLLRRRA